MGRYRWVENSPDYGADPAKFFEYPEDEIKARRDAGGRKKSVCVIGAGIAGLVAAYELVHAGSSVVLIEADQRVGGRIHTWYAGGTSGELGPMRIPLAHQGTMHYVEEFKLDCDPFFQSNSDGWLRFREEQWRIADWRKFIDTYGYAGRQRLMFPTVPHDKRQTDPDKVLEQILEATEAALTTEELWSVMNGNGKLGPVARALGSITAWQLVQGLLDDPLGWAGPFARTAPGAPMPPWRALTHAGWEFIGRATGTMWEERLSALEICVEAQWVHGPNRVRLRDGMEELPKHLKDWLLQAGATIKLGVAATRIRSEPAGGPVRVYSNGSEVEPDEGDGFDHVICAVPAAATARIKFEPALSPAKFEALTALTYMSAAKTLVLVDKRRWEKSKDKIFCGASYTDLPIQQCWYPADNARPLSEYRSTRRNIVDPRSDSTTPVKFAAIDPQRSDEPAILTAAYMTGLNAERFVSQTRQEQTDEVLRYLELIHPGIRGDVRDVETCSWIERHTPGGGAWTYHGPGVHERYQDALCEAHPSGSTPRVFFAGEHLCVLHGWMQSAIQSSLEAVLATLDAP